MSRPLTRTAGVLSVFLDFWTSLNVVKLRWWSQPTIRDWKKPFPESACTALRTESFNDVMISHPILIGVTVLDAISLAAVLYAAVTAFRVLLNWHPEASSQSQILLERQSESAVIAGRFGLAGFVLSSVVLVISISNVLPGIVPGAMCGTGVCQAADGLFDRAIMFRSAVVAVLITWIGLDRLNCSRPRAPLTKLAARVCLIGVPLQIMASLDTLGGSLRLDVRNTVECCALVYDQVGTGATVATLWELPESYAVTVFIMLSGLLIGVGASVAASSRFRNAKSGALLAAVAILWIPVAV